MCLERRVCDLLLLRDGLKKELTGPVPVCCRGLDAFDEL